MRNSRPMKVVIQELLEKYTGKKMTKVEVMADPQVHGVWAAKAWWGSGKRAMVQEFMLNVFEGEDSIEEMEFTTWPPTSSTLKFF